ncbi:MAG: IS4 family transposase, partial [Bacteroides sp.]|nr:IS4 family transposase [Bacteroides sp.]
PYRRDTIYTPLVVLRLFLLQVLNDDRSCKAAVSRFLIEQAGEVETGISHNSGPYCTARTRLPLTLLEDGVRETAVKGNQTKNDWKWHGYNIYMVDGTTVLLPDTEDNQKEFPQQKNQKPGLGFPIVRICALISLASGSVIDYAYAQYEGKGTGETSLFSNLQGSLKEGD